MSDATEAEKLQRRIAYLMHGPGRPAAHHFTGGGDEVVDEWRKKHRALVERLRKMLGDE